MNIKFQEKKFTIKKVIKLWNFGNFGIPKIIPKSLVTLRFSKISLQELKGICKCIQMRYWPNFYVDPTYSNTCFFKVGKWRLLLQGVIHIWYPIFWPFFDLPTHPYQIISDFKEMTQRRISDFWKLTHPNNWYVSHFTQYQ